MSKSLARMPARSVVLSVLLGAHPAWASAAELIRLTDDFGIKEATLRVALTRMVSAGDLVRSGTFEVKVETAPLERRAENSLGMSLALVPAGKFYRGNRHGNDGKLVAL